MELRLETRIRGEMPKTPGLDFVTRIGLRIKELREARGWSQEELAQACRRLGWKVSRGAISAIEKGQNKKDGPGVLNIVALSTALDTPHRAVLGQPLPEDFPALPWYDPLYEAAHQELADLLKSNREEDKVRREMLELLLRRAVKPLPPPGEKRRARKKLS